MALYSKTFVSENDFVFVTIIRVRIIIGGKHSKGQKKNKIKK